MLLLVHVAATWFMVGLIWTVQVVHYPLFALVGRQRFTTYADAHSRRIAPLVFAGWGAELGSGLGLLVWRPAELSVPLLLADLVLVGITILVTALVSAPCHSRLGGGFDPGAHRRLVSSNWLRTAAWTGAGVLALALLA